MILLSSAPGTLSFFRWLREIDCNPENGQTLAMLANFDEESHSSTVTSVQFLTTQSHVSQISQFAHSRSERFFNSMVRILITGGAGYVGSHCAKG
jgi:hypothetical protein